MASIGEMLRKAREAQGRSVADLAEELCITQGYLRAIEEDDVASLPGLFFFQSFARQYASILGLDRTQVGRALAALATPAEPAGTPADSRGSSFQSLTFQSSAPSSGSPSVRTPSLRSIDPIVEDTNRRYFAGHPVGLSMAGLLAAVLVGSGIFAWWTRPPQTAPVATAAPAKVAQKISTPEVSASEGSAAEVSTTPLVATNNPFEATASVDDGNQVVLNLSATEKTWLSITSHGKVIFSGILQPSQSKTLKGSEVATIKVGNAGGVDIQWNGKSIGPIGLRGQVRTVRFTREDFHIVSPEDEPAGELSRDQL